MKKFIVILFGLLAVVSCEDFLVESPKTQIALDQFFTSPEDARSAVNAIYRDGAGAFYHEDAGFRGSRAMMGGYMSGLFDNEGKGERIEGQIAHDLDLDPVNLSQFLGESWSRLYRAISRANTAIKYIPDMEQISESESQQLLAEARFFRAFNYFYLVQTFGDVPLVLEPSESLQDINVPRDDAAVIYDQIVTDLNWAIDSGALPGTSFSANNFRITEGTAATLLADVHLQMAGYPVQASGSYADAADAARTVIQSGVYELTEHGNTEEESAYNQMRNSNNLNEYIYAIEYDTDIAPSPLPRITIPGVIRPSGILYSRTLNMYRPIDEFVWVYDEDADLRIQNKQIFYNEFDHEGETYSFGEWAPYTWHEEEALFETGRGDMNTSIYRYAQVLLIAAEAIARSEGVTNEAVEYLADVRSRAYWQTDRNTIEAELLAMSEQEFVEEVWKERLRELALEFKLWPDIQRTRLYPVTSEDNPGEVEFVDVVGASNNWGQTYEEKHLLFPIPDEEMQRNPELVQNPGY